MKTNYDSSEGSVDTGVRIGNLHVHEEQFMFASPLVNRMMDGARDPFRYRDIRQDARVAHEPNDLDLISSAVDFELLHSDTLGISLVDHSDESGPQAVAAVWINPVKFHERSEHHGRPGLNIAVAVREDHAAQGLSKRAMGVAFMLYPMVNPQLADDWVVNLSMRATNTACICMADTATGAMPRIVTIESSHGSLDMVHFRADLSVVMQRMQPHVMAESDAPAGETPRFQA